MEVVKTLPQTATDVIDSAVCNLYQLRSLLRAALNQPCFTESNAEGSEDVENLIGVCLEKTERLHHSVMLLENHFNSRQVVA